MTTDVHGASDELNLYEMAVTQWRSGGGSDLARAMDHHHPVAAEERDHRQLPGPHGQRRVPPVQGLPHPAQQPARARTRAACASTRRHARRREGARRDDDLEVRAHGPAVRRRQGRHQVRPASSCSRGELERITRRFMHALGINIGPEYDIPAPGRGHQRADHGVDDGHVHEHVGRARARQRARRGHRQAVDVRRHARARQGHRAGPRSLHRREWAARQQASSSKARRSSCRASATSALARRAAPAPSSACRWSRSATTPATSTTPRASTRTGCDDYVEEHGSIAGYPTARSDSTREEFFDVEADIFVPAALENQIGAAEARDAPGAAGRRGRERPDARPTAETSCSSAASTSSRTSSRTRAA